VLLRLCTGYSRIAYLVTLQGALDCIQELLVGTECVLIRIHARWSLFRTGLENLIVTYPQHTRVLTGLALLVNLVLTSTIPCLPEAD
jgi:hypothetical protein